MKFSEYYNKVKARLLEDADNILEFSTVHKLIKYCKIPVIENGKRSYLSLKLNEEIEFQWERKQNEIIPKKMKYKNVMYESQWNESKTKSWVISSTRQLID